MKKFKKTVSLGLALVMVLSIISVGVFAQNDDCDLSTETNIIKEDYSATESISIDDTTEFNGTEIMPRHTIVFLKADGVNLRTGPGTQYTSKGLLYMPARFVLEDVETNSLGEVWIYIRNDAGTVYGWARRDFFSVDPV